MASKDENKPMKYARQGILIMVQIVTASGTLMADQRPIVIAHRGASGYLPEHTLAAKAMAHAMGADFVEQDVVLSKDHVPVVLHDVHVDTISDVAQKFPGRHRSDGRFYAIDFDLAELQTLNVMERVDYRSGDVAFPKRFPGRKKLVSQFRRWLRRSN